MSFALETELGSFADELKISLGNQDENIILNTECSIFLKDSKRDAYVLRASTTGSNYLGKAQLDTSESMRKKFEENDLDNIGLTVLSLYREKPIIKNDIVKVPEFSCFGFNERKLHEWENSHFCELNATELLSILVYPFKTSIREKEGFDGVIRLVRNHKSNKNFTEEDIHELERLTINKAPWIKSGIFLSKLIEIGSYSDIPHLCEQAAFALRDLFNGKGCTIFLLDEKDSKDDLLIYKPFGTTKLVIKTEIGKEPNDVREWEQIKDPLKDPRAWYYYDKNNDRPNEDGDQPPIMPLTLGVIRAKMPAFIDNLADNEEIDSQFPFNYKIKRKPGHGQVCEFFMNKSGQYLETESILYAPMFFGDLNNKYSEVMGVVRLVRPETKEDNSKGFSVQDKHLFVSIVERLSEAISSASFLKELFELSEQKEYKDFFTKTVDIIGRYIGGDDCTLLLEEDDKLIKISEWKEGKSSFFESDPNPYDLSDKNHWGYTGYVFKKGELLLFNNPSDMKYSDTLDSPSHRNQSGESPRRFIGIPIKRAEDDTKTIGVLRICKRDMSKKLTDNDRRMLELISKNVKRRTEEYISILNEYKEREKIFSKVLQNHIYNLDNTSPEIKDFLKKFFRNSCLGHQVEFDILDLFVKLWKHYEPGYQFQQKMFHRFELFNKNILTEIPHYRDHFIHQFAVYLMGLIIIDKLDEFFIQSFINAYQETSVVANIKSCDIDRVVKDKKIRAFIEFSWLKTALFHDIAYPVQSAEAWVTSILKKYLRGHRLDFKSRLPVGEIFFDAGYINLIDELVNFHVNILGRKDKELRENIVDLLYNKQNEPDHGIVSALLLIGESQFVRNDILPCASAIALHNNLLRIKNVDNVRFERHPLAFLLVYCDLLHEWGREITIEKKRYPELEELAITFEKSYGDDAISIKQNKNKAVIHSKIKILDESARKEREISECFNCLESDKIKFDIFINEKRIV